TSIDDECDEKFRASCEYAASDAAGCGTSFTLMPVSLWNRATSSRSRLWLEPTALSPMNVICWPLYFFFNAAAPATLCGLTAAATERFAGLLLAPPAAATLSETIRANAPASPANTSTPRCLTCSPPFRTANRCGHSVGAAAQSLPPGSAYHCGDCLSKHSDDGRRPKLAPSRRRG